MRRWNLNRPGVLIIILGLLFSYYLITLVEPGVFYSGDGGIKYLMAEQYSRGRISFRLDPAVPAWVEQLWEKDFYPFAPPFVYRFQNGWYSQYPILFPLLSAPFFRLLGWGGLLILPFLSVWVLWIRFRRTMEDLELSRNAITVWTFILIFASPLTFYSGWFWEHTLGALLAFLGAEYLIRSERRNYSFTAALTLGLATGLAVWIRSECYILIGTYLLIAAWLCYRHFNPRHLAFMAGAGAAVIGLWTINYLGVGTPLGSHSLQMTQHYFSAGHLEKITGIFIYHWRSLFAIFPPAAFVFLGLLRRREPRPVGKADPTRWLAVTCVLFLLTISLLVPNNGDRQFGPRFEYVMFPLLMLLGAIIQNQLPQWKSRPKVIFMQLVLAASILLGTYFNTFLGAKIFQNAYQDRTRPLLRLIEQAPGVPLLVTQQFAAQELATQITKRPVFLVHSAQKIEDLTDILFKRGCHAFFIVDYRTHPLKQDLPDLMKQGAENYVYYPRFLENRGGFRLYFITVAPRPQPIRTPAQLPDHAGPDLKE